MYSGQALLTVRDSRKIDFTIYWKISELNFGSNSLPKTVNSDIFLMCFEFF